jgi:hypothetical protein
VGKVVQPLQSVNYHDSRAHRYVRHGPFTRLDGYGWVGSVKFESNCVGSWYAVGVKPVSMVWLQVLCLCAWFRFGYRCDSYELVALDYRG